MKKARAELKSYLETKKMIKILEVKIKDICIKDKESLEMQKLIFLKNKHERRIKRVYNALSILDDIERDILIFICVEHNSRAKAVEKFGLSESRLSQIEGIALDKMSRYII